MKNRKLTLRRESITDLGGDDLGRIAGGASSPTCYSCPVQCVTPMIIPAVGPVMTLECTSHHNTCPLDRVSDLVCRVIGS